MALGGAGSTLISDLGPPHRDKQKPHSTREDDVKMRLVMRFVAIHRKLGVANQFTYFQSIEMCPGRLIFVKQIWL